MTKNFLKMNKILSIIFFTLILSGCCNELPVEIPKFTPPETDKVVLIEELTGVSCINCPDGATVIRNMEQKYKGQVISIAIHAGSLAEPLDSSKYDLRCEDGINLEKNWEYYGKPAAAIDRVIFEESYIPVTGSTSWQAYVEEEFKKENVLSINTTTGYDSLTRELKVFVSVIPLMDLAGNFKLNVALTESHIIDAQTLSDGSVKEDYEFDNVLRDMLTPWDGQSIGSGLKKDEIILKSFSLTLPEDENLWKPENIKVVAFVTGGEESDMRPVLNASESKIIE